MKESKLMKLGFLATAGKKGGKRKRKDKNLGEENENKMMWELLLVYNV
jgi:hypothetical protein